MNRNSNTQSLTEAAMISGILVIFSLISFYVFPFIDFLYPVPAILLGKRRGCKYAALSVITASVLVSMLLGFQWGFMYLLLYSPIAIAMTYLITKDKSPSIVILGSSVVAVISLIITLLGTQAFTGISFTEEMKMIFEETQNMMSGMLGGIDAAKPQLDQMKLTFDAMIHVIGQTIPVIVMCSALMITFVNYFAAEKFGKRFKVILKPMNDLCFFSLPKNFSIGMCVIILLSYLLKFIKFPNADAVSLNIFMIMALAFVIQGIAVLKFYLIKYKIKPVLRVLIMYFCLFNGILLTAMTFVGATDILFNFRKIVRS